MYQYFDTLTDDSGNSLLGAIVTVTNYPSGSLATIYSSNGTIAPIANSAVVSDITGQISFFAPDGAYTLTYVYKGTQYKQRSPVQLGDPMGFVAATDTGSVNALVVSGTQYPAQKYIGLKLEVKALLANTTAVTLNYQADGGQPIRQPGGGALTAGMIQANGLIRIEWDGTQWQLYGSQAQPFYPQSAVELAAGVTPVNTSAYYGVVQRYGALGGGTVDDSAAFALAALVSGTYPMTIPFVTGGYKITTPFVLPNNGQMQGIGRPTLSASVAGLGIVSATSVTGEITIQGILFAGTSAAAVPSQSFGGFPATSTGLITISNCSDVRVLDCEGSTFYNICTIQNCSRIWVQRNRFRTFLTNGVLLTNSNTYDVEFNEISDCTQAGGAVAYGVQATGNAAGGSTMDRCSISFNRIKNIPSWDGIGSHDLNGIRIVGNDIRNVRKGIDLGHLVNTNLVLSLVVSDNYIQATTTDTWGGVSADHGGIEIVGFDATHRIPGLTITGNIVDGFFNMAGATIGGVPSHIVVANADDVTVSGNVVENGGAIGSSAAVYMNGTVNRVAITGNTFKGTFAKGGIRGETITADSLTIQGNTTLLGTAADNAILFTGSTISQLRMDIGATNSTAPFAQGTSTITFSGDYLEGSATFNPPNIANGAQSQTTVTVTGAAVGDFAQISFGGALSGLTLAAEVSAANTVTVTFMNLSGGAVDLGSSTLLARVWKKH